MGKAACHIGTSGWSYKHWKGVFYPEDLSEKKYLEFFADHFETVEINNSFYHLPKSTTMGNWRKTVGDDFIFAVKASRYITHIKKLNDPEKIVTKFFDVTDNLEKKCGPILFQFPPSWHINTDRLKAFLEVLPENHFYTFEFRDDTWFDDPVYELLSQYNAAFCIYDMGGETTPEEVTADFVYVRFHGPAASYEGSYTKRHLKKWAGKIDKWTSNGKEVYCYFNNDLKGYAIKNAMSLREIVNG